MTGTETPERKLNSRLVPIDSIRPYSRNAKRGDIAAIQGSLRLHGQYRPIVVWKETKEILCGNHTWKAAKAEGWTQIWATYISCTADEAERINLADNRYPELGEYDPDALIAQLGSLPDLEGTGYSSDDLQKLLDTAGDDPAGDGDPMDEPPDDDYRQQLGVLVTCIDQEQQQAIYERLQVICSDYEGTDIRVVAV